MTGYDLESTLLPLVSAYARRKTFSRQRAEVPFYEYSIDLYCFSPSRDLTAAFELKLAKWRRAFKQALLYQLCADYVSVVLPRRATSRTDFDLLRSEGIGLVLVGPTGRCEQVIEPKQSSLVLLHYRAHFIDAVKGVHDASS